VENDESFIVFSLRYAVRRFLLPFFFPFWFLLGEGRRNQRLAPGADRVIDDKTAGSPPPDDEDEDDDERDIDNEEDDEDLVVSPQRKAAGALATVYAFVKPYLKNYKKILAFVGLGVLVETLFNVIMPLS